MSVNIQLEAFLGTKNNVYRNIKLTQEMLNRTK